MSDRLSNQLQSVKNMAPRKEADPEQRMIDALEKALSVTTPERAGCPWEAEEESYDGRDPGVWIPQGED